MSQAEYFKHFTGTVL